jgi:hypothetical protein
MKQSVDPPAVQRLIAPPAIRDIPFHPLLLSRHSSAISRLPNLVKSSLRGTQIYGK